MKIDWNTALTIVVAILLASLLNEFVVKKLTEKVAETFDATESYDEYEE